MRCQTALRVAGLQRSIQFYCQSLGFVLQSLDEEVGAATVVGPNGVLLLLATGQADITSWAGAIQSRPEAWVYMHRPGILELAATLAGRSITGTLEQPYAGYRHFLVPDPDGYVIAFWESWSIPDDQAVALYRGGLKRLQEAVAGLTEAELDLPWAPGKWSIRQVIHHIVEADMGTFQVLRTALAAPGRELARTAFLTADEWAEGLRFQQRPIGPALALLSGARAWILDLVESIPGALDCWVSWPSGSRAEVRDLLRQVGGHALHHIIQIETARKRLI